MYPSGTLGSTKYFRPEIGGFEQLTRTQRETGLLLRDDVVRLLTTTKPENLTKEEARLLLLSELS